MARRGENDWQGGPVVEPLGGAVAESHADLLNLNGGNDGNCPDDHFSSTAMHWAIPEGEPCRALAGRHEQVEPRSGATLTEQMVYQPSNQRQEIHSLLV